MMDLKRQSPSPRTMDATAKPARRAYNVDETIFLAITYLQKKALIIKTLSNDEIRKHSLADLDQTKVNWFRYQRNREDVRIKASQSYRDERTSLRPTEATKRNATQLRGISRNDSRLVCFLLTYQRRIKSMRQRIESRRHQKLYDHCVEPLITIWRIYFTHLRMFVSCHHQFLRQQPHVIVQSV